MNQFYLRDETGGKFEVEVVDDVNLTVKVVPDFEVEVEDDPNLDGAMKKGYLKSF